MQGERGKEDCAEGGVSGAGKRKARDGAVKCGVNHPDGDYVVAGNAVGQRASCRSVSVRRVKTVQNVRGRQFYPAASVMSYA